MAQISLPSVEQTLGRYGTYFGTSRLELLRSHPPPPSKSSFSPTTPTDRPLLSLSTFICHPRRTMAPSSWISSRALLLIASILALSAQAVAQASSASIASPPTDWTYFGCYNETTLRNSTGGARALGGGVQQVLDTMTASMCISFCQTNSFSMAGIEYTKFVFPTLSLSMGDLQQRRSSCTDQLFRECYCANYLNSLSSKLSDSSCDLACAGNSSQICGGNLALTVYQKKSNTKGAGIVREAPVSSILALGIAMGVLLCLA